MGQRIYLKNLVDHVTPQTFVDCFRDLDQIRYIYSAPYPYTQQDAEQFYSFLQSVNEDKSMNELGIFSKADDSFIGVISLNDIDKHDDNAELGYWILKQHWKNGYAYEAASLLVPYAFEQLHLNKLYAYLQTENVASLSLLSKLGFQVEGVLRKHVRNKGEFVDRYVCGLLRDDYLKRRTRL